MSRLVLLSVATCLLLSGFVFGQQPERKVFGKNHPFTLEELPAGRLKAKLKTLEPKAKAKAIAWLHEFSFPKTDAENHLRVDNNGGIFIVCPLDSCDSCGKDQHHDHHGETYAGSEPAGEATEVDPNTSSASEPEVAMAPVPVSAPPVYNSKPAAPYHIYLDFNGAYVTGKQWTETDGTTTWSTWDCEAWSTDTDRTTFSDSEQTEIRRMWERVAEDYAPFNVNVTTDVTYDVDNYTGDKNKVGWLLITPTTDKNGARCPHYGSGGVAYVGVFGRSDYFSRYQPAWVTPMGTANSAEAASHEMGHNIGLSHDGLTTGAAYYGGHAATSSAPSWGPIMGTGYNRNVSQWSKSSEYYNGNEPQDDLSIIAGKITYRADDHGTTFGTATPWLTVPVNQPGIVERTNSQDVFTFNSAAGSVSFNASTYRSSSQTWGGNLDVLLELYNESQTIVASSNPAADTNASISTTVPAGRYYLVLKPTGTGSPLNSTPSGYSVYGSLGQYTITGNFIPDDGVFLSSPGGGESWLIGATYDITWGSAIGGNVKIELLKNGSLHSTIVASTQNDGSYLWTIPTDQTSGSDYKIRITSVEQPSKSDESATNFSITADPLGDALDTNDLGLVWSTSGDLPWFLQTTTTQDGVDAAQSGAITHSQTSSMQTTIAGPGTLTFWWKVSSELNYDFLRFFLNGVEQTGSLARISGNIDWVRKTVNIPTGNNVVEWRYTKDGSVDGNANTAWVDQLVFTPTSSPLIVVEQPAGTGLTDGASTVNFGSVNLGSSTQRTFTIRNNGTEVLTGLALSKSGTHSADYTLGSLSASTLIPGANTTFTIDFAPGVAGTRTASLQIASNDAIRNPFDINLTGNGLGPGTLSVAGTGGLTSSGNYGGPFSPSSIQYTLSNPGGTSINWTAGKTQSWVDLSATSGTLASGASTTVTVTINASANSLNVSSYTDTVTFTNTTNSNGTTTRAMALTVNPAPATVTLGNLSQTYDGTPKSVSVTTNPVGLATNVTYGGSGTPPTTAGTYAVVATLTNPNYTGSDSKNLVIAKAAQTITFNALDNVSDDALPFELTGSASSGLAVSYSSSNTGVATVSGSTVAINGSGVTTITASQPGNINYQAATPVDQSLTVFQTNLANAVIYEPFDDANATITGNTPGKGLSGTWSGSGTVVANSLAYGDLTAGTGNTVSINTQNAYASTGTTLSTSGLLNDGASLWFSALVRTGGEIATNGDLGFALGTDQIGSANNLPVANSGQALGFTFKDNQLRASQWVPGSLIRSTSNNGNAASPGILYFIVGKITWGADSETIEIYRPTTNLSLGSPVSTYTTPTNLDQSLFNTISFGSKSADPAHLFDEIRFGTTYESVIGLGEAIPGYLAVTSTDNLSASGLVGGQFSPSSINYTLRNPGSDPINWTAGKTAGWVDLSAAGGTLAGGANTTVTVSINDNALSLAAGVYNDTVTFTNTTNNDGNTTRAVALTINEPATYTINYEGNSNTTGSAPASQTKTENIDLTLADSGSLLKTGYTFTGWNTAANGSGINYAAGTSYTTNASATLYAQWTANIYTVTFNPNGGETLDPASKQVSYDSSYGALATVARTGYTFNGWFTAASGGSLVTTSTPVTATANHTLYAQWTINSYTVSYNGSDNTDGSPPSNQTKIYGINLTLSDQGSLVKSGYTFTGWNTAANGSGTSYAAGASYTANASATLYAQWTANIYTVTFDPNGGVTPDPTSKLVTYDASYDALATTTRDGYNFNGWFTAAQGGSQVTTGTIVSIAGNHTLFAQWSELNVGINVSRNANLIAVGGYDAVEASSVGAGAKLNYDIANGGTDTLTLEGAVISGENNCVVAIDSQPSSTVSPANLTDMILTATPSAAGPWSFTISIANNHPEKNPYRWTVYGVAASSITAVLTAVADTYIEASKSTVNSNYGSQTSFSIFNGTRGINSDHRYGLLRFDLSTIPPNAAINQASLGFVQSNSFSGLVDIYEVTGLWVETAANWNNSNTLVGNATFGSESALGTIGDSVPNIVLNDTGLAKVQSWLATPTSNHGFGVRTTNAVKDQYINLFTREDNTAANHPKLTLSYAVDPQIARIHVARDGLLIPNGGTDTVSEAVSIPGTQLAYNIANLGNINLTLTTPVSVTTESNCTVVVDTQPTNSVAASALTSMLVTITPSSAGVWSANLTIQSSDLDQPTYSWTISGTSSSAFDIWAGNDGGNETTITFDGDANNDGVADGMAWLLGSTNPADNASSRLPLAGENSGKLIVSFDCLKSSQRGTATLHFQHSNSLAPGSWTSVEVPETSGTVNGVTFIVDPLPDSNINRVQATAGGAGRLFGRLSASLPQP